jgi:hypothetical protein
VTIPDRDAALARRHQLLREEHAAWVRLVKTLELAGAIQPGDGCTLFTPGAISPDGPSKGVRLLHEIRTWAIASGELMVFTVFEEIKKLHEEKRGLSHERTP